MDDELSINRIIKYVGKGHTIGWTARKVGSTPEKVGEALSAFGRLRQFSKAVRVTDEVPARPENAGTLSTDEEEELQAIGITDGTTEQAKWLVRKGWSTAEIARKLGKRYQQIHHAIGRR